MRLKSVLECGFTLLIFPAYEHAVFDSFFRPSHHSHPGRKTREFPDSGTSNHSMTDLRINFVNRKLMVNWWFWSVVGFLGSPKMKGIVTSRHPSQSQTTNPKHQFTTSWNIRKWKKCQKCSPTGFKRVHACPWWLTSLTLLWRCMHIDVYSFSVSIVLHWSVSKSLYVSCNIYI